MEKMLKNSIALSDVINAVQRELIVSQKKREKSNMPPLFKTKSLVLEANCIVTKDVKGNGEVKLNIPVPLIELDANAEISIENSMTQKITIEFSTVEESMSKENSPNNMRVIDNDGLYPHFTTVLRGLEEEE